MNDQNRAAGARGNNLFTQALIGLSDGAIIAFAAATAFTVIYPESHTVLKITALLCTGLAVVMGIGGYLSAKIRMETLAAKTIGEEERLQKEETAKTISLFKKLGIDEAMQEQAAGVIEKDSLEWKRFLEKNQQPFEVPDRRTLPVTGILIGLAFIAGAIPAIFPFMLKTESRQALQMAAWINVPFLLLTGIIKSKANGEPVVGGTIRLMLLGIAAAAAAYFVAGLFAT